MSCCRTTKITTRMVVFTGVALLYCGLAYTAAPLSVESVQANRSPAVISSDYLPWFPLQIEGQATGPLVYVVRVKNEGTVNLTVRAGIESYRTSDKVTKGGKDKPLTECEAGGTADLVLKLFPPRTAGKYRAKIQLEYQEKGLFGSVSPLGWKKGVSTEVDFTIVGTGEPLVDPPDELALGIIKAGKPPYQPDKAETVGLLVNAISEVVGGLVGFKIPGIGPGTIETRGKMMPSMLAGSLLLKKPVLEDNGAQKVLKLKAIVTQVRTGSTNVPFYKPAFDRLVFFVQLPEGAAAYPQDGWLVEKSDSNGGTVAIGIVDGLGKRIGQEGELLEPELELRFIDRAVQDKYEVQVMAMGLVGPFGAAADDDALSEANVWPITSVALVKRENYAQAPWVYDYSSWRKHPGESIWYSMSTALSAIEGERREQARQSFEPEVVLIRGGTFRMGSPSSELGRGDGEGPVHQVTLSDFYMGKYEVTISQFRAFLRASIPDETEDISLDWLFLHNRLGENVADPLPDNYPIRYVSWTLAVAYCEWLSEQTGRTYRLPTEAEWEYACRAGTNTRYSCGDSRDELDDYANYRFRHRVQVVGSKKPNLWGLYDMHGNVQEWCADWYDSQFYSISPKVNPQGPRLGSMRVMRGGAAHEPWEPRSALRISAHPDSPVGRRPGFRVARGGVSSREGLKYSEVRVEAPEMVFIEGGTFQMGGPDYSEEFERPVHEVTVEDFYLGKYEVTFAQYDVFCEAANRRKPDDKGWGRSNRPAIDIVWDDAVAYCEWLSTQTGKRYRLPTEAEWEYACRAGTTTPFSFGPMMTVDQANYDGRTWSGQRGDKINRGKTLDVGSFSPNSWGLHDMHGNAAEVCHDWFHEDYYKASPKLNPQGPSVGEGFVVRGGSYYQSPRRITSWSRSHTRRPRPGDLGFRVARDP